MKEIQRRREALKTFVSFNSGTSELHKTIEKAREIIDHSKAEISRLWKGLSQRNRRTGSPHARIYEIRRSSLMGSRRGI
ncbi:hypothetical protein NA56DRAFT_641023 [Hyaloscypha hepaticicola]|uniref:Uncharacterized protein n=1 Tax=Hyaloscypha hepaticicola TaxID=2082293 RepID=A0A2J6QLZ8_9HELO|nr:hypothetical protein NA56DRAFT_641023 [Hyaloscypha hepaticicola]